MKGLNLQGFSKIKEDKDMVHMKNKDGHVIQLAVKALPKIQREQLKRLPMAEGGEVKPKPTPAPSPGPNLDQSKAKDFMKGFSSGRFAEGGDVEDNSGERVTASRLESQYAPEEEKAQAAATPAPAAPPPININVQTKPAPEEVPVQAQQPMQQGQPQQEAPVQTPSSVNLLNPDQTLNVPKAVELQQQAAREQQQVDIKKGQNMADVEQGYIAEKQDQKDQIQKNYNELKGHVNDFARYNIEHPINEKHYVENMGAGNKIANAFGLLMGGFKQGFSGGSNPAMDFLNQQIQRDIEGQKSRAEQHKTIYGAYKELYGEGVVANNLTTATMNDIYSHKAQQIAAQVATPQAKATADAFSANKALENNALLIEAAGRRGTLNREPNQKQNVNVEQQKKQSDEWTILNPGAASQMERLIKYDSSIPDVQKTKMASQMTQVVQAEKSLQDLRSGFTDLANLALHGGVSGRIHRKLNPHTLAAGAGGLGAMIGGPIGAGLGAGLGEAVGQGVQHLTDTDINRRFESFKSKLEGMVSSALPGRGVGFVTDIVNKNTPEYGDSVKTLQDKLAAIKEFIMKHTETDALDAHHLSHR